jgi:hypothetical protein
MQNPICRCHFALLALVLSGIATSLPAAEPGDPLADSLHASLEKKTAHLRRWIDEKDFKSLAQSSGGVALLGQILRARSDDTAWQSAVGKISIAAKKVQEAAEDGSGEDSVAAVEELERACTAAAKLTPAGKPQALPKATIAPLMHAMDGVYADVKIAMITGNASAAKKQAYVLSELGRVVSNAPTSGRTAEKWAELSSGFVETSLAAASSPVEDVATVKQLMRSVGQQCEACHKTR